MNENIVVEYVWTEPVRQFVGLLVLLLMLLLGEVGKLLHRAGMRRRHNEDTWPQLRKTTPTRDGAIVLSNHNY